MAHVELKEIRDQGLPPLSESPLARREEHLAAEVRLAQLTEGEEQGSGGGGLPVDGGVGLRFSSDCDE